MKRLELKLPPPILVLILATVMWAIAKETPTLAVFIPFNVALAVALAGAGVALALSGVIAFVRARTTVNPLNPEGTSSLVTSGVYRITRNPMYVGFLVLLLSWAVYLSHLLAFLFLPVFVIYMNRFQIRPEERILTANFGEQYVGYMNSVRRWL